ncbi:MAG: iron ABC transporter substrate-binding protein, partial [Verrucomicrobiota bacterium]
MGIALACVLAAPFFLRSESSSRYANAERKLIIISPHNDHIRTEFSLGFSEHMEAKTGELVTIEWRDLGGTSEIVKFLDTSYRAAFEHHWKQEIKTKWEGP